MRFDPDLARQIMLQIEATPANRTPADVVIEGSSEDEIFEHIELLRDDGYIEAKIHRSGMGNARIYTIFLERLTRDGHEFLAAARNDTLWKRAKDRVTTSGGAMTLGILRGVLTDLAKRAVGLGDTPPLQ